MSLRTIDSAPKPVPDVVAMAERILADAKSGRCRAIVCAAVYQEPGDPHCSATMRAGTPEVGPMVAALEGVKLRLLGFVEKADLEAVRE